MSLKRRWHNFRQTPVRRLLLVVEAAFWLCIARLALIFVRFPVIGRYLGTLNAPSNNHEALNVPRSSVLDIKFAVDCASRYLPVKMVCLPCALAGWQMLKLRNTNGRLHFGAARDPNGKLLTHAWLDAYGIEITGYPVAHDHVEIGYFTRT